MAPIPAGSPLTSRHGFIPVCGALLALALPGNRAAAVDSPSLVHPEIRLGVAIGPHLQSVEDTQVRDKRSYALTPGVFADVPFNRILGFVVGLGADYRFGTSRYDNGKDLSTECAGGQVSGGLSFHLGSSFILETLMTGAVGHAHARYSLEGEHPNHYGAFTDYAWQANLLFHENQGVKVGVSFAYDWFRLHMHDDLGDPYDAKGNGLQIGFIGAVTW